MIGKKINQLATELAPVSTDLTIIGDPISGVSKKITLAQLGAIFSGAVSFYTNLAGFPATGDINVIYCAKDTQKLYLWSGSAYTEVFPSQALLDTYQLRSEKGNANGYASLDSGGKVPISQLPSSIMEYKGTWNAATNTPTLANGTGDTGDVYICNVAGTVNFGAGPLTFAVGDYVIYSGSIWQRSSGAVGTVTSVALTVGGDAISVSGSPVTTSGTLALAFSGTTSQYIRGNGTLATFPSLTGFVPYTGATANVDLGTHTLLAKNLVINHSSGSGVAASITKGGSGEALTVVKSSGSGNAASITGGVTLLDELHLNTDLADAYIASATNWNAAYNDKINSAAVTGTTTKTLTLTQQDGGTITASWTDDNTDAVTSVFGRTGAVVAVSGDYNTSQVTENTNLYFTNARAIASTLTGYTSGAGTITSSDSILSAIQKLNGNIGALTTGVSSVNGLTGAVTLTTSNIAEGTNLYYTEARVNANTNVAANTAARHNAVTIGTANGLSLSTQVLSLALASGSTTGALSSTDWTTFNNKQNALTNPVTGTGTTNYLPKFTGASTIGNSTLQEVSGNLGLGVTPSADIWTSFKGIQINTWGGGIFSGSAVTNFVHNNYYDGTNIKYFRNGSAALYQQNGNIHAWHTAPSGTAGNAISFTQAMTLGSNSGLSIGTTSAAPAQGLLVQGAVTTGIFNQNTPVFFSTDGTDNSPALTIFKNTTTGTREVFRVQSFVINTGVVTVASINAAGAATFSNLAGTGTRMVVADANGLLSTQAIGSGSITGSGTTNYLPKFTGSTTVGNSQVFDDGVAVGIGTTTPSPLIAGSRTLEISQAGDNFPALNISRTSGISYTNVNWRLFLSSDASLHFRQNSTDRLILSASGNLGLGVTPSAWSITPALQVVRASIYNQGDDGTYITSNGYFNAGWKYIGAFTATQYIMLSGQHRWLTAPSGTAGNAISFTQAMTLDASGRLFVGLTSGYSNGVTIKGASDDYALTIAQSNASNAGWGQWADTSGNYKLARYGGGSYSSPALTIALSGAATFSSSITTNATSTFSNASSLSAIFSNGGAVNNYNSIELRGGTAGTSVNWQISKDNTLANGFELAPSTTAGGTTYGSSVFKISSAGAATFSSSVTATTGIFSISAGNPLQVYQTAATNSTTATIRQTGAGGNGNNDIGLVVDIQAATDTDRIVNFRYFDGTNYNSRFTVQRGGNVGIGTTAPNSLLEVNRTITFSSIDTYAQLVVKTTSGANGKLLNIGVDETNSVSFIQSLNRGTDVMPLSLQRYGGAVLIGTTTEGFLGKLQVAGSVAITGQYNTVLPSSSFSYFDGSGQVVSSSSNASALYLDTTWNTTGNPDGIYLNVTNTASGASSKLLNLKVGSVSQFSVSKAGAIQTTAPSSGSAQPWKLGSYAAGGTGTATGVIYIEINGQIYSIPALEGTP
jgi:hypothetical protein